MQHTFTMRILTASIAGSLLLSTSLTGCGTVQTQVNDLENKTTRNIEQEQAKASQIAPVVTRTPAAWLMGQTVRVAPPPSPILSRNVGYHPTQRVTLADVAAWIYNTTGVVVDTAEIQVTNPNGQVAPTNAPTMPTQIVPAMSAPNVNGLGANTQNNVNFYSFEYEGALSGLLDLAANKAGVWWKFSDGRITFYRTETKTFYLPAIANKSLGGSSISANSGSGGGASLTGSSTSSTSLGGTSSTSNYSVDIWGDLDKTAQTVGGGAKVVCNASVGSVTVTGTPTQVRNVEEWVRNLAENLGQQVAITVHIYKVKITNEDNYNWNPTVVFNSISDNVGFKLAGPQAPAVLSGITPMGISANVLQVAGTNQMYTGSQVAFQALSTIGRVTETVQQTVVTLNGQPAPIQVANQTTYLASTTMGPAGAIGAAPVPPTLTPGTITTGFTAMFLPKVVNGKVLLSMNMTSSSLIGIGSVASGGSNIQTPNVDLSTFQQSVSLTPGDALLLTGLQQDNGKTNRSGVGSPSNFALGGGLDDNTGKQLIAIVITAKVL